MYHPTTRLLTILELLQTHAMIGGPALAKRLEVEPRTIRRYVLMLQDMGMPVETVRGPGGGYRLRPGFKLPPLLFTEDEATAIVLGLLQMAAQGPSGAGVPLEGALAKVLRVLPVRGRERLDALTDHLTHSPSGQVPVRTPDPRLLLDLSDATQQHRCVRLSYTAQGGALTERTVEPYGLASWWGDWFLVGHCRLRQAVRVFRLDRIGAAALTSDAFTRPSDFAVFDYLAEHLGRSSGRFAIQVVFQATLEQAQRRIPPAYGALSEAEAGTLFETRHGDLAQVAHYLVGLGLPFTVQAPAELKTQLAALADQLRQAAGLAP